MPQGREGERVLHARGPRSARPPCARGPGPGRPRRVAAHGRGKGRSRREPSPATSWRVIDCSSGRTLPGWLGRRSTRSSSPCSRLLEPTKAATLRPVLPLSLVAIGSDRCPCLGRTRDRKRLRRAERSDAGRSGAAFKRTHVFAPSSAIGPAATAMHRLRPAPRAPRPPRLQRFRFLADAATPTGWLSALDPRLESVLVAYTGQRRPPHSNPCPFLSVSVSSVVPRVRPSVAVPSTWPSPRAALATSVRFRSLCVSVPLWRS